MKEFSVLMSVYIKDNPIWLKEALNSMVKQTVLPTEFLIIEDGPLTEELENILKEYQSNHPFIKIHALPENVGLGLALKKGMELVQYDLVARMDSDDLSVLDRFERQLECFEHKDVDLVGSVIIEFDKDPFTSKILRRLPEHHEDIVKFSKKRNPIGHSSVMFKKEAVLKAGNYRDFYLVEDYDLWIRMLKTGSKFYNFQIPLTYMRISKDFYKRRGGIKYYRSINKFKKMMYKEGYITYPQYLKTNLASLIVTMMPGFLRTYIYKKFLRKKVR